MGTNGNALLVLAAGKSSRFGGYPKAFCTVGGSCVAQRTVDLGGRYYDDVYLAISREMRARYEGSVTGCKTLCIGTGQGDAHSFLRAARLVREDCGASTVTLCWGDTFHLNDAVLRRASEIKVESGAVGVCICAVDEDPYAWFEVDGRWIRASYFRSADGPVPRGIHDQSTFVFRLEEACEQLEHFMGYLEIDDGLDFCESSGGREMMLLDSFAFFYDRGFHPMRYTLVDPGACLSFNTAEELEGVRVAAARLACPPRGRRSRATS